MKYKSHFPLSIYPDSISKIILELHHNNQFCIDYSGCAVLSSVSTGIGNTLRIEVKHTFIEPVNLNMALVGDPGTNKSAPIKFFLAPFYKEDVEELKKYREALKDYNYKSQNKSDIKEPKRIQTIVNDTTIEGIIALHEHNPKGLCLHSDELMGWINTFGRYNKGSDEQTYLVLYNGGPLKISRKNAELDINLPYTCVNVIGSIQPAVLPQLIAPAKIYNGFVDRILFAYPIHNQSIRWTDGEANPAILNQWDNLIGKLIMNKTSWEQGYAIIKFDDKALNKLRLWQNKIADQDDKCDNPAVKGLHAKLETYVIRFCLILHVLHCTCNNVDPQIKTIEDNIVDKSILLYNYFEINARRVRAKSLLSCSKYEELYNYLPESFETSEALEQIKDIGIGERTYYRFIRENVGFTLIKKSRGCYKKI